VSGEVHITADAHTAPVHVPLRLRKRGGRKLVIGEIGPARSPLSLDGSRRTILKALGRAYRWKRMLESGDFASITDLAAAEKINHSYVRRILRLTLLSPEITQAILDGGLQKGRLLEQLLKNANPRWDSQKLGQ
jgi:hypothetical protein